MVFGVELIWICQVAPGAGRHQSAATTAGVALGNAAPTTIRSASHRTVRPARVFIVSPLQRWLEPAGHRGRPHASCNIYTRRRPAYAAGRRIDARMLREDTRQHAGSPIGNDVRSDQGADGIAGADRP